MKKVQNYRKKIKFLSKNEILLIIKQIENTLFQKGFINHENLSLDISQRELEKIISIECSFIYKKYRYDKRDKDNEILIFDILSLRESIEQFNFPILKKMLVKELKKLPNYFPLSTVEYNFLNSKKELYLDDLSGELQEFLLKTLN